MRNPSLRDTAEKSSQHWTDCGLPLLIAEYLANWLINTGKQDHPVISRARRFRDYWEKNPDDEIVKKNWSKLESNVVEREGAIVDTFLVWPDTPARQPYSALYSKRRKGLLDLTVEQERTAYAAIATDVEKVLGFLRPSHSAPNFRHLLEDASATGDDVLLLATTLRNVDLHLPEALRLLSKLLREVDPSAKYPTRQPDAADAAFSSYIAQLAGLNLKFVKEQSTAIMYLANINTPDHPVTAAAIRMAWTRNPNTKR